MLGHRRQGLMKWCGFWIALFAITWISNQLTKSVSACSMPRADRKSRRLREAASGLIVADERV
jgi:hypothetical protein